MICSIWFFFTPDKCPRPGQWALAANQGRSTITTLRPRGSRERGARRPPPRAATLLRRTARALHLHPRLRALRGKDQCAVHVPLHLARAQRVRLLLVRVQRGAGLDRSASFFLRSTPFELGKISALAPNGLDARPAPAVGGTCPGGPAAGPPFAADPFLPP